MNQLNMFNLTAKHLFKLASFSKNIKFPGRWNSANNDGTDNIISTKTLKQAQPSHSAKVKEIGRAHV